MTSFIFLQSIQHFAQLHTRQTKDLNDERSNNKELKKSLGKYKKEVKNLKQIIDAKSKRGDKDKDPLKKKLKSYKDQVADL